MGILDCFGISKSDFNAQQLSHSNASDAVVDEKIDGYIISGSLGQSHQMKAMASGKCKLADLGSDEEIQNVINRLPYYYEYTIPSGTYPNQESDVKTVATGTLLIVNESISDDLVYEITKNLFEMLIHWSKARILQKKSLWNQESMSPACRFIREQKGTIKKKAS